MAESALIRSLRKMPEGKTMNPFSKRAERPVAVILLLFTKLIKTSKSSACEQAKGQWRRLYLSRFSGYASLAGIINPPSKKSLSIP